MNHITEPSTVRVQIPPPLRALTSGEAEVQARGRTVGEALRDLGRRHGGVTERILTADGDAVRSFVDVFVDDQDIRRSGGLDSPLADAETVSIVPAGGPAGGIVRRSDPGRVRVARLAARIERQQQIRGRVG